MAIDGKNVAPVANESASTMAGDRWPGDPLPRRPFAGREGVTMNWFFDPKIFNYIILSLYLMNSLRWAIAGSWGDCLYWAAAFQITAAVTWGFQR